MDTRCVRVMPMYEDVDETNLVLVDEAAFRSMGLQPDADIKVRVLGRNEAEAKVGLLRDIDKNCFVARATQDVIDAAYVEYGEEVFVGHLLK